MKQDHFAYDEFPVLQTVIMGNDKLFKIMEEKDAIYAKEDFSDEDGIRASELEADFAEMNGWEAESDAGIMLAGLGIGTEFHEKMMKDLAGQTRLRFFWHKHSLEILMCFSWMSRLTTWISRPLSGWKSSFLILKILSLSFPTIDIF